MILLISLELFVAISCYPNKRSVVRFFTQEMLSQNFSRAKKSLGSQVSSLKTEFAPPRHCHFILEKGDHYYIQVRHRDLFPVAILFWEGFKKKCPEKRSKIQTKYKRKNALIPGDLSRVSTHTWERKKKIIVTLRCFQLDIHSLKETRPS